MDEPTNDLDIESLELLEATLQGYAGTLLLVSHDRAFLDNVVTQTLAPMGDGQWQEYVGGYSDWLAQRPATPAAGPIDGRAPVTDTATNGVPPAQRTAAKPTKLNYKESRELELLPQQIETLEAEQQALHARMADAGYHQAGARSTQGRSRALARARARAGHGLRALGRARRAHAGRPLTRHVAVRRVACALRCAH